MKKILKLLVFTAVISMSIGASNVFANNVTTIRGITSRESSREHPSIFINNEKLDIYANVTNAGTTLVPMRPILEAYGMTLNWDNKTKTVTATKDKITIQLTHNLYEAIENGKKVKLNEAPVLSPTTNTFYVNLRFISETLGAKVTWNKTTNDASIYISFPE